jgi:adenylate kinase
MRKRALKENRIDDASDKVIDRRIAAYEAETKPILAYYPADRITVIDATQPPVKVFSEIVQRIITLPVYDRMKEQAI